MTKSHERPSIGVLLCATKDDEVVEYALARTTSPSLVAEYQTTIRVMNGDFDLGEEVVQEAFAAALARWPVEGEPAQPRAWLISVARHKGSISPAGACFMSARLFGPPARNSGTVARKRRKP